jgi:hypothetical protein
LSDQSLVQKDRVHALVKMLVRLMLPISIADIEKPAWLEYMRHIDPSFSVPSRETIKNSGLGRMRDRVMHKMRLDLERIEFVNVSCDGWSDRTMRSFNGYIVQGIDIEWNMLTIPIAFQYVKGSHTGAAIKTKFDEISSKYGIAEKIFKIIADQASNMKNAFKDTVEANDVIKIDSRMMFKQ